MAEQRPPEPVCPAPTPTRPSMPGYGLEAASDPPGRRLPWSRVRELLEIGGTYGVCTVRPDGRPHVMPVWGFWLDGAFYFSSGRQSRKARNLAANPAVAVHLEHGDEAVILEGAAEEVTDPSLLERWAAACEAKYGWSPTSDGSAGATWEDFFRGSAVYAVRPRVAFSFTPDLAATATRWRFPQD